MLTSETYFRCLSIMHARSTFDSIDQLSAEQELPLGGPESFHVQTLMGKRDIPELELCARQIIALMATDGCTKPLLISLALKDHSMETITAIVNQMKEMRVW